MAKRILFALMCTLFVLTIVMGCVVFSKVSALLSVAQPPQGNPGVSTGQPEAPSTESTETTESEPSRPTEPPHEHNFVRTESISATCTAFGYNVYSCQCGKTHLPADEFTNPLGHNYVAGETVELTCTQDGYTPYTCTRCEDVDKRDYLEAEGHDLPDPEVVDPTCDKEGYTVATCTVCEKEVTYDIVQPNGHDYGDWEEITEAGDATPGKQERTCETCNHVDTKVIPPTGTLTITDKTQQTLTDSEDEEYIRYVVTVGTEETPDAYTYTVDSYLGELTFTYDENGLTVSVTEDDETEPTVLKPYEDGTLTLKLTPPEDSDQDDPIQNDPDQNDPDQNDPNQNEENN